LIKSSSSITIRSSKISLIIDALFCKSPKRVAAAVALFLETDKPKGTARANAYANGNAS